MFITPFVVQLLRRPKFRVRLGGVLVIAAAAVGFKTSGVEADPMDIVRDSIPQRWIEDFLPEKLPDLQYPAYFDDIDKTEAQSFHGRYRLSLITASKLKPTDPAKVLRLALARARSLAALGRSDEAMAVLNEPGVATDPQTVAQRAGLLLDLDRPADAMTAVKAEIAAHPDSIAAHELLGRALEQTGDIPAAIKAYAWFVDAPQSYLQKWTEHDKGPFDRAEHVTAIGRAVDRWASLTEAYRQNPQLDRTILSFFVRAYDSIDRGYWPAHVAAARYFKSHDQDKEALEELALALKANPNDEQSWRLLGDLKLKGFDFDSVDQAVDAMHRVNPQSAPADLLAARNLLLQRRPQDAEPPINRVLLRRPSNIEALGLLAAANALMLKEARMTAILAQVDKLDPHNATAYYEVAQQLSAMRQYPRSAEKFKVAIARAPWWTEALNGLGLLYTQSGDEEQAHVVLDTAHKLDPFNLATTNYLRLLDKMDKFTRKESEHFVIIYDAKTDPVIPEYFIEYLESVQADISAQYRYTPPLKTYIEVFPTHEAFSVRTTGSPWIGTVGASTGRVIALVAPRTGENTMGTFNWSQVLRHEYTHTVTLGATDNRIQHWMTEGLAVYQEHVPLRWEWVPMLYSAVHKHELFPLQQLTWSFVRPKRPIDRQLAYAESYWICKYVEETFGHEAILRMLDDCRNAMPQEQFFPKETGRSLDQFQAEFFDWCSKQVATWGYDEETSKKYEALREQAEEKMQSREYAEAAGLWEEILKIRPMDSLPHQRLAGIYLSKEARDPEKALAHLDAMEKVELKDNRYAKRIARLYRDLGKWDDAFKYALQAVYIDPYDMSAHDLLAKVDEKTGNVAGVERENRVVELLNQLKASAEPAAPAETPAAP